MKNILMITTAFCVGVGGVASAQAWQVAEELAAIAAEEAQAAEANDEVVVDSPDPRLMALGGVGGVTEEVVKSPPTPTPTQGQTVFFDGAVKITDMIPALMLHKDYSGVPSLPSSAPYFATDGLQGGFIRGHNLYEMTGREGALPLDSRLVDEWRHEATELPMLHSGLRNHVKMSGTLVVKEATPAYFTVSTNITPGAEFNCMISTEISGTMIADPSVFPVSQFEHRRQRSGSFAAVTQLEAGKHDFEVEVYCPVHKAGSQVSSITLSGVYSSKELPIQLFNADIPAAPASTYDPPKPPATGVIWTAKSPQELPAKAPEIGVISEAIELVSQYAQQLNFVSDVHSTALAAKTMFYPTEEGVYSFLVITSSNVCHATARSGSTYEGSDIVFSSCNRDIRHPAVMLTLDDDRRGIISAPMMGSKDAMVSRTGAVQMSKDDVHDGVVLSFAVDGEVGLASFNGSLVDGFYNEGMIVDGGETFNRVTGRTDEKMAFTPTDSQRASMTARILVRGPSDTYYRLLNEEDVTQ